MKIALLDPYKGKFTSDMKSWWETHGYEVRTDPQGYYNPELVDWADVVWFDTVSNNLISATNPEQALIDDWRLQQRQGEWDIHLMDLSQKKIIVRAIDIDVWAGHHASVKWDVVDDCIFIAPHIRDMMMADSRPQDSAMKIHTIPCGVDLDKWAYSERSHGKKIGIVAERWVSKGVDYAIQLALQLPDYEFHWLGQNNDYHWEHEYLKDMVAKSCPNLILEEDYVEDLNAWWEDKNYVLSCSKKESFGYSIGEAMAKGIMPLIHKFYGAEQIWPEITWVSLDEVIDKLRRVDNGTEFYYPNDEPSWPRDYLKDHKYTLSDMMMSFEEVIRG